MATKSKKSPPEEAGVPIKGAFRVQITEDGDVVHDTGTVENVIVAAGWLGFAQLLMSAAGSTNGIAKYVALGTGATMNASTNALLGELSQGGGASRQAITSNSQVSQTDSTHATAIMSVTFPSGNTGFTGTVQNLGLYVASTGSNLIAGNTFAGGTQALASNQAVNATYSIALG